MKFGFAWHPGDDAGGVAGYRRATRRGQIQRASELRVVNDFSKSPLGAELTHGRVGGTGLDPPSGAG